MRYFSLLIGAILISSCSQSLGSMPSSGSAQSPSTRLGGSAPSITKISTIKAKQYQKITITGSGFGTMKPYDGDSGYLQILDNTGGWSAGYTSSSQIDSVWLQVTKWSNKKIVITGFTGDYGESYWTLKKGDDLEINVWNAPSGSGPATMDKTVK
jgi:hypothetical protein